MASLNATAIELLLRFQRLLVGMLYPPSEEHRCSPDDSPNRRPSKLSPKTLAAGSLLRKYTVLLVSHVAGAELLFVVIVFVVVVVIVCCSCC